MLESHEADLDSSSLVGYIAIIAFQLSCINTGNRVLLEYNPTWKKLLDFYNERECIVEANMYVDNL